MNRFSSHSSHSGFTLPELMTAFVLTLLAISLGLTIISAAVGTLGEVRLRQQSSTSAQIALERLGREIRAAQTSTFADSHFVFTQSANAVHWQLDARGRLLRGTPSQISGSPDDCVVATSIEGFAYQNERLAITLRGGGKPYSVAKTLSPWVNTLP